MSDSKRPEIVILDDEPGCRDLHALALRWLWPDAHILDFENGTAAWEQLNRRSPDLFITDLNHLGMDSFEMLQRLAAQSVCYPIMVISACLASYEQSARAAAGPDLRVIFIPKPWELKQFHQTVQQLTQI